MTQVKNAQNLSFRYRPFNLSDTASYRYDCILKYKQLRAKGFSESDALSFLNLKRSTFFRWLKIFNDKCGSLNMKTTALSNKSRRPHNFRIPKVFSHSLVSHILKIRQDFPMYGKEKIKRILEKDGVFVSVSTVGRVIKYLLDKNKIDNIRSLIGKNSGYRRAAKRRRFAERIRKQKPSAPGELVQIDHMVLNLYNGLHLKEFRAVDPITKISISRIYSEATALNAKAFLKDLIFELDFPIKSIQVDGGSEFMAEFEDYCQELGIKLFVLPPRSPKMNGIVERTNETYRYEFWNRYEIPDSIDKTRILLKKFERFYNFERLHQNLNYLTPMQFYNTLLDNCA